jgi:heat shock protein HtpX
VNGLFKVFVLIAGLTALFVLLGGAIAGRGGMVVAFLVAAGMNLMA